MTNNQKIIELEERIKQLENKPIFIPVYVPIYTQPYYAPYQSLWVTTCNSSGLIS